MDTAGWIVLAIIAIVIIAVLVWAATRKRRSEELRERFGPEYDRTMDKAESRRAAESDLASRRDRVSQLDIRPLPVSSRERFATEWKDVQAHFVDDPRIALNQADQLVELVMRERGYPMDDFEQRAADISVDHPHVVEHYRAAHDISRRADADGSDTEEMRQALVHYRALFSDLLDDGASNTAQRT
jgi:FtsZ-interacting cell division protein ZipA